jgi:hypothetical protein
VKNFSWRKTVKTKDRSPARRDAALLRCVPQLERLEDRWIPTITATGTQLIAAEQLTQNFQVATFTDTDPSPVTDYSATIDWGDGTTTAGTVSQSGNSFKVNGTHTYAEEVAASTPEQLTVTIQENNGADQDTATAQSTASVADADVFTVGNLSLTATGAASFNLAAKFTDSDIVNSASDYTASIDWGDGNTTTGTIAVTSGGFTITGSHTYAGTGNFNVSVTLADDPPSLQGATSTGTAIVGSNGLTVAGGTLVTAEGQPFTGTVATFFSSASGSFTASIDWGDGVTSTGTIAGSNGNFSITGTHTYAEEGSYTTATVSETGGSSASATGTAQVKDAPLAATGPIHKLNAGVAANHLVVATFTDTGGAEAVGNYTATIDFGDGTTGQGTISVANGTFTVIASHTFANQGTFTITTTIQDEGGSQATVTSTTAVGWIAGVYLDLLHRPIDPTGLTAWNALLNQGLARQQIVADIESSVEYRTDEVQAVYTQFLHRNADAFGLSAFVNALGSGMTLVQVEALLLGSQEFFNDAGGTNAGFLTALYQDLLHRPPDAFGMNAFLGALNAGASRQAIAVAILSSDEYHQDLIKSIYLQYLRRNADSFGLNAFTQAMHNGLTEEALIAIILGSQEYFALTV